MLALIFFHTPAQPLPFLAPSDFSDPMRIIGLTLRHLLLSSLSYAHHDDLTTQSVTKRPNGCSYSSKMAPQTLSLLLSVRCTRSLLGPLLSLAAPISRPGSHALTAPVPLTLRWPCSPHYWLTPALVTPPFPLGLPHRPHCMAGAPSVHNHAAPPVPPLLAAALPLASSARPCSTLPYNAC